MMQINQALFAADLPVERKVTLVLDDGEIVEQIVYIRALSALAFRKQILAENSGDDDVILKAQGTLIANSVCDAEGGPAMTLAQACQLKPTVAGQLRDFIMEVSGMGKARAA